MQAETIERMVVEYRTGSTAADLGRRYGVAKTTVLRLIRQPVNPSGIDGSARLRLLAWLRCMRPECHRRTSRSGFIEARVPSGTVCDG